MNKITIDLDNLPEIPGYDREAQKSIVKLLTTGEADLWEFCSEQGRKEIAPLVEYAPYRDRPFIIVDSSLTVAHARPVKPFDTRLGKLTDADSYNGNTPDRRPLVCTITDAPTPRRLFCIHGDDAIVEGFGYRENKTVYLASPSEVDAAGMPREWAGLREEI
jgi:hypothetical protein